MGLRFKWFKSKLLHAKKSRTLQVVLLCVIFVLGFHRTAPYSLKSTPTADGTHDIMDSFSLPTNNPIWNFRYDATGNSANDRGYSLAKTSDGRFVVPGQTANDFYLLHVDADGRKVWNTTVDNGSYERARDVIEVSSVGYAACGYVRIASWNYFYLVRFDSNENVDWMKNYTGRSDYEARALAETDDGGFILVGSGTMGGPLYVVKTDLNGVQTWDAEIHGGDVLGGRDVLVISGTNG